MSQSNRRKKFQPPAVPKMLFSEMEPMDSISVDFFSHCGNLYIVCADLCQTRRPILRLGSSGIWVISMAFHMNQDGRGLSFHGKFHKAMNEWGISHNYSSPHMLTSNGSAEHAVGQIKLYLAKLGKIVCT